eukprot:484140-Pelagomonas_calceolata.AAC.6
MFLVLKYTECYFKVAASQDYKCCLVHVSETIVVEVVLPTGPLTCLWTRLALKCNCCTPVPMWQKELIQHTISFIPRRTNLVAPFCCPPGHPYAPGPGRA